jgi:hypothetical protein
VSQLEELAAGNLHGEVCEGGDSGASQYRISSTRSAERCSINSGPLLMEQFIRLPFWRQEAILSPR